MIKIAIAQIKSSIEKSENLDTARTLIRAAEQQKATLIAFPEFLMAFSPGSQSAAELSRLAEPINGPFISALCDAAKAARLDVLAAIYETCGVKDRVYDTAVWIGANGAVRSHYRKLHLYDAFGFKESDKFQRGDDLPPLVKTSEACSGVMICYDLRFPEMARMLALEGANILLAPSGWVQGDLKVEHWQTMIKARALENGCFVIAPNQVGNIYTGHSLAVDPMGRTLADLGEGEGLRIVELDLTMVDEVREKLPLLKNRRSDAYQSYFTKHRG